MKTKPMVGSIVRYTREFLRSIGSVTGPINGLVVAHHRNNASWVWVVWCDRSTPSCVSVYCVEPDKREMARVNSPGQATTLTLYQDAMRYASFVPLSERLP